MFRLFTPLLITTILIIGAVTVFFFVSGNIESTTTEHVVAAETTYPDIPLPTTADVLVYGPRNPTIEPNFFKETRDAFIAQNISFIEVNLTTMTILLWEQGIVVLQIPIQTKGRPGSWWQTPAGVYKVETKKEKHFSSFGNVYTDWNLPFQGNFFIHGWPYQENGEPVPKGYSGGCIRLTNEDAKAFFERVSVGIPVLVYEDYFSSDNFSYTLPLPTLSASSYIVMDIKNNEVLTGNATEVAYPIASLTKLITALIATEYINLDKKIVISETASATETTKQRFNRGDSVLAFHLLYPLLNESSNEAALALTESVGTERYITLMNEKAKAIGMISSSFADTTGMSVGNNASASDLARLAQYLYYNRPFILNLSAGKLDSGFYASPQFTNLANYNLYSADESFIGGKVGKTTSAQETMLAVFNISIYGTERPIAFIILGSEDVKNDMDTLRAYITNKYDR